MAKVWKWIAASVIFWLILNVLAVYELAGNHSDLGNEGAKGRNRLPMTLKAILAAATHRRDISRDNAPQRGGTNGELPGELEPEDSDSSSDTNSAQGNSRNHQEEVLVDVKPAPPPVMSALTKKPKGKDTIPRSIGNSVAAATTTLVAIPTDRVRFAVVGDWGGPGRKPQQNVASAMHTVATLDDRHHIDFVVSTGDNMYEDGVSGVKDRKFKRNFEDVYVQPSLQCVWYMSLGNHDHGAHGVMRDAQAEVNYTRHSKRWFLPSTYYSQLFAVGGGGGSAYHVQLIVLDTYDYSPRVTQMTDHQLRWFESTLAQSTADVKIVVGHRPLFSAGAKHGSSPYMQKKLEPLLTMYGVTAYLCGDDHELQVMQSKGVVHLLSGGGARAKKDLKVKGIPQTVFQAGVHGFMWVSVNQTTLSVEVYNQFAEKLFEGSFPTPLTPPKHR